MLFTEILNFFVKCGYIINYFSTGSLVAVVAFILAFLQFLTPIIRFRLRTGIINLQFAYVLFLIGIVSNFIGTTLVYFGENSFCEIYSGLIIVATGLVLLYESFRPAKFTKRNSARYFDGCYEIVAKNKEKDLLDLAEEIRYSLSGIVCTIKRHKNKEHITNEVRCAFSLMELFSDESFCALMVMHNPFATYELIKLMIDSDLPWSENFGKRLIQQLLQQLFVQENSILYREHKYNGLGVFHGIKKLIFGDVKAITSPYRPLQIWDFYGNDKITAVQIEKYFEVLKLSLRAYLDGGRDNYPLVFLHALEQISEVVKTSICGLSQYSDQEFCLTKQYKIYMAQ